MAITACDRASAGVPRSGVSHDRVEGLEADAAGNTSVAPSGDLSPGALCSVENIGVLSPDETRATLALCDALSADELVERPGLMARWARVKLAAEDLAGALTASRIASSLAFGPELAAFRVAEILFQAAVMRRSGHEAAAHELLGCALEEPDLAPADRYALHAAIARMHLEDGHADAAAAHLDSASKCAQTPTEMISLLSIAVTHEPSAKAIAVAARPPLYDVRVFGGLEVRAGGRLIDLERWRKNKARALFLSVVLEQGRDVSRESIMNRLWPSLDPAAATNNYYVTWNGVKRLLCGDPQSGKVRPPMPIANSGQRCSLRREACTLDLDRFDAALAAGRGARSCGDYARALEAYSELKSIYRGELLPGDTNVEWLVPYREYYRSEFVDAMGMAARTAIDAGQPADAMSFVARGLASDRYAEALYELAVEASIEAGHRDEGIRAYLRCRALLAEEYGLDPSRRLQALYGRLLEMDR